MRVLCGLLISIAAASAKSIKGNDTNVKITVYYEAMCPDSIRFVAKQLGPTFKTLGQYMDIVLKPFGKANFTAHINHGHRGGWDFTCQHGDAECVGNMMQACILNQVSDPEEYVPLISCIMAADFPLTAAEKCLHKLGITTTKPDTVKKCATSAEGQNLHHEIGVETHALQPPLTYVPWIIFNDKFIESDFEDAQKDLKGLLCKKYLSGNQKCH